MRKKAYEQLDTLKLFDNLTNKQIDELTSSKYIKSTEAGIVIEYLGYQKFKHKTPQLLEFLQNLNWPASYYVVKNLRSADKDIIPHVKNVFEKNSDDIIWIYWIIEKLISTWSISWTMEVKGELLDIIKGADGEGAAYEALLCLKKVISEKEYTRLANELLLELKKFETMDDEVKELQQELGKY